ncbi:hypothetical protein SDC9_102174 [bioreactor metagenome]|uniref:Uncharacterized protein n=1 Tax=bioreactor metagenome TaxID=1076179 RepID=A0A645AQL8_9ZZZZ
MSRVILLTRAFLKSNFGSENATKRKEKKGWEYANIIAIIFAFIAFTASIGAMLFGIYDFLEPIQQTGLLVALGYNVYALSENSFTYQYASSSVPRSTFYKKVKFGDLECMDIGKLPV